MSRAKIDPTPALVKAVSAALWTPDEPERLLIERRLLDSRVLDGRPKAMALDIIKSKMKVGQRQAYKILRYLLDEEIYTIQPERLLRMRPKPKAAPWNKP